MRTPTPWFAAPPYHTRASHGCNEIMRTVQLGFIPPRLHLSLPTLREESEAVEETEAMALLLLVSRPLLRERPLDCLVIELTCLPVSTWLTLQMT